MRTRLKQGSNQHVRRHKFIKGKTWLSILAVLLFFAALSVDPYTREMMNKKQQQIRHSLNLTTYAYEAPKDPELAPLPEREANIRIIKKVWRHNWEVGVAIATCESGLRSEAFNAHNTNGTWDAGLFQVNTIHSFTREQMFDPIANAGFAYSLFTEQNTNPWDSSSSCWKDKI